MAQKQKTASAWAGLPCTFSASEVSYFSAWPGEEGDGGDHAWTSLLLGFQKSSAYQPRGWEEPRKIVPPPDKGESKGGLTAQAVICHPPGCLQKENQTSLPLNKLGNQGTSRKKEWSYPNQGHTEPRSNSAGLYPLAHAARDLVRSRGLYTRVGWAQPGLVPQHLISAATGKGVRFFRGWEHWAVDTWGVGRCGQMLSFQPVSSASRLNSMDLHQKQTKEETWVAGFIPQSPEHSPKASSSFCSFPASLLSSK